MLQIPVISKVASPSDTWSSPCTAEIAKIEKCRTELKSYLDEKLEDDTCCCCCCWFTCCNDFAEIRNLASSIFVLMKTLKEEIRQGNREHVLVCMKQLTYKAKAAAEEARNNDKVYVVAVTLSMKVNGLLKELEVFLKKTSPQPLIPRSSPSKRVSFYLDL